MIYREVQIISLETRHDPMRTELLTDYKNLKEHPLCLHVSHAEVHETNNQNKENQRRDRQQTDFVDEPAAPPVGQEESKYVTHHLSHGRKSSVQVNIFEPHILIEKQKDSVHAEGEEEEETDLQQSG